MPAENMNRAWYSSASSISPEEAAALHRLEARHSIRNEITNAIKWARFYGGSLAIMVIRGEDDSLAEPLNYDSLTPGCFQRLLVVDRVQGITPSVELVSDLDGPDFGIPEYYDVSANMGG